jgi:hypothetical protein
LGSSQADLGFAWMARDEIRPEGQLPSVHPGKAQGSLEMCFGIGRLAHA